MHHSSVSLGLLWVRRHQEGCLFAIRHSPAPVAQSKSPSWVLLGAGRGGSGSCPAITLGWLVEGVLSLSQHPEHQQAGKLLLGSIQQLLEDTCVTCKGQDGWEGGVTFPALSPG